MAARMSAAASHAPGTNTVYRTGFDDYALLTDSMVSLTDTTSAKKRIKYSRTEITTITDSLDSNTTTAGPGLKALLGRLHLLRTPKWRKDIGRTESKRKRCARTRKRGKRAGVLARLKANAGRPPIPSLFLANVRSLDNKMDMLRLRLGASSEMKNSAVICLTETWLKDNMPDPAFQLDGRLLFRADRNQQSGKTRGGGLCIYIHKGWCTNCTVVNSHCSEAIEHMTVKCRPHYLPREFTAVFIMAVYIPPGANANANEALTELHNNISSLQHRHPEAFYVIAGDFNHVNLTDTLPKFHQHINFPTRGNNILDCVYTNKKDAYRAVPHPHLGFSDHIAIMLAPVYHPLLRRQAPTQRTITVWPSEAASALQDCFQHTDWQIFREAASHEGEVDLEDYASGVLGYISKCTEDVTSTRTVTDYPNQKPWLNTEVRALLKHRNAAFQSGDKVALRAARRELHAGVRRAKAAYAQRIQGHFTSNDPRSMWKGIKCITDYNTRDAQCPEDPSLPDALNLFYSRFEDSNTAPPSTKLTIPPGEEPFSVTPAEVRRTLQRINPHKAAGPDNIPGRVLKDCAHQLTEVLTDIFNTSLMQAVVPTCLKTATIIPIPKSSTVTSLNDYRPVALTPIVMKCFEKLVMTRITESIDITKDLHQYAYRSNRSTEDAISSVVHTTLTHLENKNAYVRLLFVDFTSAFNTIIPQTLTQKLHTLGLNPTLCNWVLDFLTDRPQSVKIRNVSSSPITLSTGSPQGCVLSPLLFTLLTHDCTASHPSCLIVKFADDTAVVGRISNNDESDYRQEVEHLESWCRDNNLCINGKKTKEMIVDFRKDRCPPPPIHIGGDAVEVVSSFRYLGVHISSDLTWSTNTSCLVKKAHQRLYFLRRLKRAGMGIPVLTSFYRCVVESVMTSCITVWHGSCSAAERKALQRVTKAAQRTVGCSLPSTTDIYTTRCRKRASRILKDPTHPSHPLFSLLPSGRRLRSIKSRTTRLRNSFFPEAVRLLNSG
uniref:Reverse transcriptase domain-containing protein n=1 Tax=Oryzias latipes TaxID=8090 RepID=A0A3B3H7K8_ORYLA